ncbi:hypothetical protein EJG51_005030 [Undibacterium piscinae]|uniref:Uncharacterized protein n=1 Tax=Undibacterium piscinae TaxID=2495591 RepID=A0A6M4A289_9BURK|nr:hypothetical protein EJG51_005030 [Undibacterium piscinae]
MAALAGNTHAPFRPVRLVRRMDSALWGMLEFLIRYFESAALCCPAGCISVHLCAFL